MINEKTKSSDRLTGKKYGDLILDTGASHHITGELSFLENVTSILPCPVGFADGNKAYATHTGVLHLSNNIRLLNVLFVPNLNCSLISVAKLLRQTNCFALLTDTLCVLQDRFTRTLIGASEERDGVYFFKDVMAAHVQVADKLHTSVDWFLWHQQLGHPSFSVLSFLPMFSESN